MQSATIATAATFFLPPPETGPSAPHQAQVPR
jgi:hypothetical protein